MMNLSQILLPALIALFLLAALWRLIRVPLRIALGLLCNTLLGFLALWLINLLTPITGISLGFNAINALIIGVLGLPGFFFLLLVQWVL